MKNSDDFEKFARTSSNKEYNKDRRRAASVSKSNTQKRNITGPNKSKKKNYIFNRALVVTALAATVMLTSTGIKEVSNHFNNNMLKNTNSNIDIEYMNENDTYKNYVNEEDYKLFERYFELSENTDSSVRKERLELSEQINEKYFGRMFGENSITNRFYSNRIISNDKIPEGTRYRLTNQGQVAEPKLQSGKYQEPIKVDAESLNDLGEIIYNGVEIEERDTYKTNINERETAERTALVLEAIEAMNEIESNNIMYELSSDYRIIESEKEYDEIKLSDGTNVIIPIVDKER